MLKVCTKVGRTIEHTEAHINYITAAQSEKKRKTEYIFTSENLKNKRKRQIFLEEWQEDLTPKQKGQRRSRQTDKRIIISWKGDTPSPLKINNYMKAFMKKHFEGHKFGWACHSKQNRHGGNIFHIHILINPRHSESGKPFDLKKKDLFLMKQTNADFSKQLGFDLGYNPIDRAKSRTPSRQVTSKRISMPEQAKTKEKAKAKARGRSRWVHRNKAAAAKKNLAASMSIGERKGVGK